MCDMWVKKATCALLCVCVRAHIHMIMHNTVAV